MVSLTAIKKIGLCGLSVLALAACSGTKSSAVAELTQNDKHMDCTQLQLEITEAQFLMDKAEKNRGANLKNILLPLSYPSTFFSASNAIDASSARIDYLTRLHEVKGCKNQRQASSGYEEPVYGAAAAGLSGGYGAGRF